MRGGNTPLIFKTKIMDIKKTKNGHAAIVSKDGSDEAQVIKDFMDGLSDPRGLFKKGDRVRKIKGEPGDVHPMGMEGIIIGKLVKDLDPLVQLQYLARTGDNSDYAVLYMVEFFEEDAVESIQESVDELKEKYIPKGATIKTVTIMIEGKLEKV